MNESFRKEIIDESRASVLLGLPREQLRMICLFSGFGREEDELFGGNLLFTYEELHQLCRLVVGPPS